MELPKGWACISFKCGIQKIAIHNELKIKQKDYNYYGTYPIIDQGKNLIGGYTDNPNLLLKCQLPSIVFGDHTKITKYVSFPFCAGADGIKVFLSQPFVLPKMLFYFVMVLAKKIPDKGYARHYQFLEKEILPIPPFAEQRRIVEKIDALFSELDKGVETIHTIKQQLKTYRQSVLTLAFDGKVFETSSILFTNRNITDFFTITGGLTKNSSRNKLPLQMPYLRVANVYYNFLDLNEIKTIGVTEAEISRTTLLPEDLLFVEGNGSKEQIGRVAIWNGELDKCLHQNHIIKGRPNGIMLSQYALYYLMSRSGRKQILAVASSTSGLYTLSISKIKSLFVPYCEEQTTVIAAIESRLSICEKLEQLADENLEKAEALRQSILRKAFEGRLVPQDPNDEPAEKLLERIRMLRTQTEQAVPKRRKKNG